MHNVMHQIFEKTRKKRVATHHIFVDFKAAVYHMNPCNTKNSVKRQKIVSESIDTKQDFRQRDSFL